MRSIRDVFLRAWFINIILAGCVAFVGAKSIGVWSERGGDTVQTIPVAPRAKTGDVKKVTRRVMPPEVAYGVVTDKDLFRPERVEFVEEKTDVAEDAVEEDIRVSGKKVLLYGVVIVDDYRVALINDPKPKSPQRTSLWVKEGESVGDSNIVVSAIKKESITLRKGKNTYEVLLYQDGKPRDKVVAAQEQTKQTAAAGSSAPEVMPGSNNAKPPGVAAKRDSPPESGQYKTVNTPFGKIKVKVRKK
ncbi:MAG: hypothetical protein PHY29_03390 [Syntrophales bacterium]|nr:hypothetical protein [Syntrophales bacterium]